MTDCDDATDLAAMWNAFVAQGAQLLAANPGGTTADEVERSLERLSEPLIDLIGRRSSSSSHRAFLFDLLSVNSNSAATDDAENGNCNGRGLRLSIRDS